MNVIVTGSRDAQLKHAKQVTDTLFKLDGEDVTLIQGGARGVDRIAAKVAESLDWKMVEVKADWDKHGKAAGPLRNAQMVEDYPDALVIAFPLRGAKNKGTMNMVKTARRLHMRLKVVELQ